MTVPPRRMGPNPRTRLREAQAVTYDMSLDRARRPRVIPERQGKAWASVGGRGSD